MNQMKVVQHDDMMPQPNPMMDTVTGTHTGEGGQTHTRMRRDKRTGKLKEGGGHTQGRGVKRESD